MSNLKLEELTIETMNYLKFKERNRLQIKLITDYRCQLTINK